MPRLTQDAIVAQLERQGLRFRTVTCETEGEYLPADVDWNNKDTLHLNHVHSWVRDLTFVVDPDLQASVSFQKIAGVEFPLVLVHYDNGPDHQTHVVTTMAWTVVTEHRFVAVTGTRTRAITRYAVGGGRFWMLLFPAIRWAVRRNYRRLMSEDVPLRERRGLLRSWGYRFRGDEQTPRSLQASLSAADDNVILPEPDELPDWPATTVPLEDLASSPVLLGRNDHRGLRLVREGDHIVAYPRLCPHEGADLDDVFPDRSCLRCPWHGRRVPALTTLPLDGDDPVATTPWHELRRDGQLLRVGLLGALDDPEPVATDPA